MENMDQGSLVAVLDPPSREAWVVFAVLPGTGLQPYAALPHRGKSGSAPLSPSLQSSTYRSDLQPCTASGHPATHFSGRRHGWRTQGSFPIPYSPNTTATRSTRQTLADHGLISSMETASSAARVPELMYQAGITLFLKAPSPLAESKGKPSSPAPSWCCFTAVLRHLKDLLLLYFFGRRIYCPH